MQRSTTFLIYGIIVNFSLKVNKTRDFIILCSHVKNI